MKFRAMKFRVNNPEHSRVVQQVLFDLGYGWFIGGKSVDHTNVPHIYAESTGVILNGEADGFFITDPGHEIDVSWMDPHLYKEEKTVEVGGKVYRESEVIERCKPLDPVG